MTATRYDLSIEQGADVDFSVQVYADNAHTIVQNITGWTAKMQLKSNRTTTATVYATYNSGVEITINGPAGQVVVHVAGSVTRGYTWTSGVWDLFVYGSGNTPTKRIAQGDVTVSVAVTS
jgi:hypothetical protein